MHLGYYTVIKAPFNYRADPNLTYNFSERDLIAWVTTGIFTESVKHGWEYKIYFCEEALKKFLFKKNDLGI